MNNRNRERSRGRAGIERGDSRDCTLGDQRASHAGRGVLNGFDGLIWPEGAKEMTEESFSGILPRGGTILGTTNRGNPFAYKAKENGQEVVRDYSSLCMDNARRLGIDAIVVIGGDRTQHIARDFWHKGMNIVGVPKTIDNDLDATDMCSAAVADTIRPHPGDAVGGSYRFGGPASIWAHGLPESWQNGLGVLGRGLGENEVHRSGKRDRSRRARGRSHLRGW